MHTYTTFQSISTISENNYVASFTYNPESQRAKMVVQQSGNTILTRWYSGSSYVKETAGGVTKQYTYIGGDAYTAPVVAIKTGTGTPVYYYLLRDYLGSITHVVNTSKTTVAEYSYDAWGRMRNPTNWTNYAPGTEPVLFVAGRGFTGHEHMPWFNSINMNGRVYDPLIGQFLSPDNYVQAPDFTQNLNRYSYCLNNPLAYTDPSGEFVFSLFLPVIGPFLDAACWGAVIGGAGYTANVAFSDGGFNNWNWGQFGKSVGIGAISGAVTAGIGNAFGAVGSNGIGGEIARAYTHGFANGMISEFSGGDFMSGFVSGGLGSLGGSAFSSLGGNFAQSAFGQISFSAISGGIGAELAGDDFWRGAATGATIGLLNHASATLGKVQRERIKRLILKDGRLNLREANLWWDLGEGGDLTVEASKVDLDFLNPDGWIVGQKSSVQTLLSSRDGRVYGTLILKYLGNQQFMISPDTYDFPSGGSWFRNFANTIGRIYAGKGTGYTINFNGLNTVFHKWWRF